MPKIKTVITDYNLITAYGQGINPLWEGILSGQSRINKLERFSTKSFISSNAATVPGLSYLKDRSLVMQMLKNILNIDSGIIPNDAFLILATTVGEIDLLEKSVLQANIDPAESKLTNFLKKVKELAKIKGDGMLVSCACASSSTAIAQAARMIGGGKVDCVLVVAADAVTEFVFSGFSSLMALDKDKARPFDKNRSGLSLGEAAGFILLMSQSRAKKEKRNILAQVSGWGLSCDANHMTGPTRDGSGLSQAIHKALKQTGILPSAVGGISSHGTGTLYNDSMELKAFKNIFKDLPIPIYSIKGAIGHTLGAAGLIEVIVALKAHQEKTIPGTVGLKDVDDEAVGNLSNRAQKLKKDMILSNNCGFGGINSVLLLKNLN
jgi:3-oxoacyl-[acyl-carrier-protein] synthase II